MAQPRRFKAEVTEVTRHTDDIVTYRLVSESRLPRFTPGQFIHLTVDPFDPASFWPESRVFSVANSVADRKTVNLTISRQGVYTGKIIDSVHVGDVIWAKGPYGEFTINQEDGIRNAVLIAGGTGVTPFCAVMDTALSQGRLSIEKVKLYYGAQSTELLLYRDLADKCDAEFSNFEVEYYVEGGVAAEDSKLHSGRLNLDTIVSETPDINRTAFYLSGPKAMIDAFSERLTGFHGVSEDSVRIDAWD